MSDEKKQGPIASCIGFLLMCGLIVGGCGLIIEMGNDQDPVAIKDSPAGGDEMPREPVIETHPPSQPVSRTGTPAGKQFVQAMWADLVSFAPSETFAAYGFGDGGPHAAWRNTMDNVTRSPEYAEFSVADRIAIGQLDALAMRYLATQGQNDQFTTHTSAELQDYLTR